MAAPECKHCSYVEGPPDLRRLTNVRPRSRAVDERPFTELVRESWARLEPDTVEAARRGIADARARLELAKERKGVAA